MEIICNFLFFPLLLIVIVKTGAYSSLVNISIERVLQEYRHTYSCVYFLDDCFTTTMAKSHNCDRDHVAYKVKILGMRPFLEKVCWLLIHNDPVFCQTST